MIEKTTGLNYTIPIRNFTDGKSEAEDPVSDACREHSKGRNGALKGWYKAEWLFLPAVLLGLAAGAQNFWVFCKERLDRTKKEKNDRVGFNSHQ